MVERDEALAPGRNWDHVVVGAGSAGAALAARLSEDGRLQVLLLEAGPDWRAGAAPPELRGEDWSAICDPDRFPQFMWPHLRATRTPRQAPELYWRGRGLGGSSAINGQYAIRPPLEDFDSWGRGGGLSWSAEEVLPFFVALEDDEQFGHQPYHGRGGPIPIHRVPPDAWGPFDLALHDAARAGGMAWAEDCNAPGATGVSCYPTNRRNGWRVSTNDAYLEAARSRVNLTIQGDALVDRVLFDATGSAVVGVRAIVGGRLRDISAGHVTLCAGAVQSPAILLRSGVGRRGQLGPLGIPVVADLPVGENLLDHPALSVGFAVDRGGDWPPPRCLGAIVRTSSGVAGADSHDVSFVPINPVFPSWPFGGVAVWLNQAFSRGEVRLASRHPHVDPVMELRLASDRRDLERLRWAVDVLRRLLDHDGYGRLAAGEVTGVDGTPLADLLGPAAIDDWILRTVRDAAHATGTCAMGDVVDDDCRVLGLGGLRVVDMSVAPRIPRANPHLTAVMLGERLGRAMAAVE